MQIISQNPYQILGLLADCSEREIQKQKSLIKRFVDIGKEISFNTDINLFTKCNRNNESITIAFTKIEQVKGRVANGLFWFVNDSLQEQPAISYLQCNNYEKALEIWNLIIPNVDTAVTASNCFAFHNLSILKLGLAFEEAAINKPLFTEGILLKAKLLNSDFFEPVIKKISDETFLINKIEINKLFADELLLNITAFLDRQNGISSFDFMEIVNQMPEDLKNYISSKFIDKPFHTIENLIKASEENRKENNSNFYKNGNKLIAETKNDFTLLQNTLGSINLQLEILSDKLANEIRECSISYFNRARETDSDIDAGEKSLELLKVSNEIVNGSSLKIKIENDFIFLENWIKQKPMKEEAKIDIDAINNTLEEYVDKIETAENGTELVNTCKPHLESIKTILGDTNEIYISLSTEVCQKAQNMVIADSNNTQDDLIGKAERTSLVNEKRIYFEALRIKYKDVYNAMVLIDSLDKNKNLSNIFNENKNNIVATCTKWNVNLNPNEDANSNATDNTETEIPLLAYLIGFVFLAFIFVKGCN